MLFSTKNPFLTDVALLLLRLVVGVVFICHGAQKVFGVFGGPGMAGFTGMLEQMGIPYAALAAWAAALAELVGGGLLLIGLLTRLAAIPPLANMLVAAAVVHRNAFDAQQNGMEYAVTLAVVLVALILTGAGRFSADALFRRRRAEPVPR